MSLSNTYRYSWSNWFIFYFVQMHSTPIISKYTSSHFQRKKTVYIQPYTSVINCNPISMKYIPFEFMCFDLITNGRSYTKLDTVWPKNNLAGQKDISVPDSFLLLTT